MFGVLASHEPGEPVQGGFSPAHWSISYRAPLRNMEADLWLLREDVDTIRPHLEDKSFWIDAREDDLRGPVGATFGGYWDEAYWHADRARRPPQAWFRPPRVVPV